MILGDETTWPNDLIQKLEKTHKIVFNYEEEEFAIEREYLSPQNRGLNGIARAHMRRNRYRYEYYAAIESLYPVVQSLILRG